MASQRKSSHSVPVITTSTESTFESPLFPNLNNVKLLPTIKHTLTDAEKLCSYGIFTHQSFAYVLRNYDSFDILPYSISRMHLFDHAPIARLIFAVGTPPRQTKEKIQLAGTHAKLWLCYRRGAVDAYIGSSNATEMTLLELVVKLDIPQTLAAKRYFEQLWTLNKP